MKTARTFARLGLCVLAVLASAGVQAQGVELDHPSGRRVLLKDDGTWAFVTPAVAAAEPAASAPARPRETAELLLLAQSDVGLGCRYEFELRNTLPYEIRSLVPFFSALRPGGVVYATESLGFGPVKPGDVTRRALRVAGIACRDVARLQVTGGDRCEMGELNKFSDAKGECLARLRVQPSEFVVFDK